MTGFPYNPDLSGGQAAKLEALRRAHDQTGSPHEEVPRQLPKSRLGDWLDGHRGTMLLMIVGVVFVALLVL